MAGCAPALHQGGTDSRALAISAAQPPSFLTGLPSVLLTNAADYRAHLVAVQAGQTGKRLSGTLFQQTGWLLFVPGVEGSRRQTNSEGSFRFLWDVNGRRGYALSEALQGFAPLRANDAEGAPVFHAVLGESASARIGERDCTVEEFAVQSRGEESRIRVWRSDEATEPPVRIRSSGRGVDLTLELSELEVERLSPELFSVPPRFSKYEDAAAMVRELLRKPPVLPYSSSGR